MADEGSGIDIKQMDSEAISRQIIRIRFLFSLRVGLELFGGVPLIRPSVRTGAPSPRGRLMLGMV